MVVHCWPIHGKHLHRKITEKPNRLPDISRVHLRTQYNKWCYLNMTSLWSLYDIKLTLFLWCIHRIKEWWNENCDQAVQQERHSVQSHFHVAKAGKPTWVTFCISPKNGSLVGNAVMHRKYADGMTVQTLIRSLLQHLLRVSMSQWYFWLLIVKDTSNTHDLYKR